MSSTVGHAMCGITCLLAARGLAPRSPIVPSWRTAVGFALLANLPDIDFLIGFIVAGNAHRFHSGPTHSLAFALVAAAVIAAAWRGLPFRHTFPWVGLAIVSHIAVDLFAGPMLGFSASYGLPLFWPFEDARVRVPFTAFLGVQHATLGHLFGVYNLKVIVTEIITLAPPLLLLAWFARSRGSSGTPFRTKKEMT